MKKLINAVDAVVREQLMGMAAAHPELKVRIEPHYITRADSPRDGQGGAGLRRWQRPRADARRSGG